MLRRVADISVVTDEEWMMVSEVDAADINKSSCSNSHRCSPLQNMLLT